MRSLSDVAAAKYQHSELPPGNVFRATDGNYRFSPPDALAPFHLASRDERNRRVRDVLLLARRIYSRGDVSMVGAVAEASDGSPVGEYAKISLRRILLELNLSAWESHPNRTRRDVQSLFRKAIGRLTPHRGGWQVSR